MHTTYSQEVFDCRCNASKYREVLCLTQNHSRILYLNKHYIKEKKFNIFMFNHQNRRVYGLRVSARIPRQDRLRSCVGRDLHTSPLFG